MKFYFFTLCLCFVVPVSNASVTKYIDEIFPVFFQSNRVRALVNDINTNEILRYSALLQSPFTLRSSLGFDKVTSEESYLSLESTELTAKNKTAAVELDYRLLNSFNSTFSLSKAYSSFSPTMNSVDDLLQFSVKLEYDLVKGGENSSTFITAKIERDTFNQSKLQDYQNLNSEAILFRTLLAQFYSILCKEENLKKALISVNETVSKGELLLKTKNISYKDYLNFLTLRNSFDLRIASLNIEKGQLEDSFISWGDKIKLEVDDYFSKTLKCYNSQEELIKLKNTLNYKLEHTDSEVQNSLPVQSAKLGVHISKNRVDLAKNNLRPSILPYLQLSGSSSKYDHTSTAGEILKGNQKTIAAGISIEWDIPWTKDSNELRAATLINNGSKTRANFSHESIRSQLIQIERTVLNQESILDILIKTYETNQSLVLAINAQRSIGRIDSFNYTSAFLALNETVNLFMDSISSTEVSIFSHHVITDWEYILSFRNNKQL
jgi:hypothetical protein